MAWNGSDSKVGSAVPDGRSRKGSGNHVGSGLRSHGGTRSFRRGLLAGLIVVAIGGAAVWWLAGARRAGERDEAGGRAPRAIAEAKQAVPKKAYKPPAKRKVEKTGDKVADALAEVEASGELVKISAPPKAEVVNDRANRFYKNGVEQLLGWIVATEPGDMPMPMPCLSDEDRENLVSILAFPCPAEETDDDTLKQLKESVNYGKKEMAKFVADGGDPNDFFHYCFQQLKQAFETHNEAQAAYMQICEEDPALASDYRKKVNELLAEKGIKPIEPDSLSEPEEYQLLHPEENDNETTDTQGN